MSTRLIVLALALPIAISAQASQAGPFAGTWKLNLSKSRFDPGPPPKRETLTISPNGKVQMEEVDSDGKRVEWSVILHNGTTSAVNGLNATVFHQRLNDTTTVDTWKFGDYSQVGKAVLSNGGKTMTYDLSGRTESGRSIANVKVFEKQ